MQDIERRTCRSVVDFVWILKGQLYSLRIQWFWYVVLLSISPLSYLFFLWYYSASMTSSDTAIYVISGSIASSAVSAAMLSLGQTIASMRQTNVLEFYATLPVSRLAFVLALAGRGVLLAFPSALVVLLIGSAVLNIDIWGRLWAVAVVYLAGAFSLAGLGAMIGFYSRTPESASLATQVIQPLLVLFAPVYMPIQRLPDALQITSRIIPTTYVADAMRGALGGSSMNPLYLNLGVLILSGVASLSLALRRASWRVGRSDAR